MGHVVVKGMCLYRNGVGVCVCIEMGLGYVFV